MATTHFAQLGFSYSTPEGWDSIPIAWTRKLRQQAAPTSAELAEILNTASSPFLYLQRQPDTTGTSIPTIQCVAKPIALLKPIGGLSAIRDLSIAQMHSAFSDFKLLEALDNYLVGGTNGIYIKTAMSVKNEQGESFPSISECVIAAGSSVFFIIGLSGTADQALRPQKDFDQFIRSLTFN